MHCNKCKIIIGRVRVLNLQVFIVCILFMSIAIDGDGMIVALTFINGRVHLRTKFVESNHRMEEQEKKKFLYRGQMGTNPNSALKDTMLFLKSMATMSKPRLQYRNPSNTNVFYWGGKVIPLSHNIYE